jgi:hypothetical protein
MGEAQLVGTLVHHGLAFWALGTLDLDLELLAGGASHKLDLLEVLELELVPGCLDLDHDLDRCLSLPFWRLARSRCQLAACENLPASAWLAPA